MTTIKTILLVLPPAILAVVMGALELSTLPL